MTNFIILRIFFILFFTIICSQVAQAEQLNADAVSQIVSKFSEQSEEWYRVILDIAKNIFYFVTVLELGYIGIQAVLGNSDIRETFKQLILAIVAAGFFLAVINNYQEWSSNLILGLQEIAGNMTTIERSSNNPFVAGMEIFNYLLSTKEGWGEFLLAGLVGIIVVICFALITARIVLIKCEVIVASAAALLLVPLGASKFFREYAINTIRYIFSVAFKLFTMQLLLGIAFSFLEDIKEADVTMTGLGITLGFSIILYLLVSQLPEMVASIITGSHVGSGTGVQSATGAVSGAVVGGAVGAVGGAIGASRAISIAKESGATGFGGIAKGAFSAMTQARQQGKMNHTNMGTQLKDNLNTIREINK